MPSKAKVSQESKATKAPKSKVVKSTETIVEKKTVKPAAKTTGLTAQLFDITGKSQGTMTLPKEIFGQKINENLITQAIRVYFTNQTPHAAHTKTRSEVRGGGKKPWRQKGTGRARAGSIRSSIWVGGGKALGPRKRDVKLTLPKKMKKAALTSALSQKAKDGQIKVITSLTIKEPKTKIIANLVNKLSPGSRTLIVTEKTDKNLKLASRNIQKVSVNSFSNLNAFEVIKNNQLLISKEAIK